MNYRFEYLSYQRNFRRPLTTAHGVWASRKGMIIRLEREDGVFGFGEVAPVPWFGTETLDAALHWCGELEGRRIPEPMELLTKDLPCTNWAVASALDGMRRDSMNRDFSVAALVAGPGDLEEKREDGYKTFKLKIGATDLETEQQQIDAMVSKLDAGQQLRLDANGGLSERQFKHWLEFLEGKPVEFLEQPLAPGLENRMLEIAEPFSTTLALDESIAGMESLLRWRDWPGILVVKPSLLGWVGDVDLPAMVGSSVFETAFGFEAALRFLGRHHKTDTAIGFGVNSLLADDGWTLHKSGPTLSSGAISNSELQTLWEEKREAIS